ncbi:hypothetical protein V6N13_013491 [Hibiscus sabdariffa]
MQDFRFVTPPAAVALAVAVEKCHGRAGSEPAVVDIEGSGNVDVSAVFWFAAVGADCFEAAVDADSRLLQN